MFNHHSTSLRYGMVIAAVLLLSAFGVVPAIADNVKFSGQATGVQATVLGLQPITISDTGPLDSQGGQKEASLFSESVGGISVEILHSSTIGQGDRSRSEASVASLNLTAGGNTIGATFLMANAMAVCNADNSSSASGGSEVAELVINNGQPIVITGQPNQTIFLPGDTGKVIINEQKGDTSDMTVNALHVTVYGVADVIVASAHADVKCLGKPICDTSRDFVTGGGWIDPRGDGSRANFAVAGGNGSWGHLQYIDHGTGMKVKGTGVTGYLVMDGTLRHIEGTCEIDGSGGKYYVDVADNGEPGGGKDTFSITLSNGYKASGTPLGTIAGGNIQIHSPCK